MADPRWERVAEQDGVTTQRLQVPGGWLYRVSGGAEGSALAFAPAAPDASAAAAPGQKTEHMPRVDD